MRPTLYTVARPGPGTLSTMAKPRPGDWLPDEMAALADHGVDVLVSALQPSEVVELDLCREGDLAHAVGLRFVRLPIPDRGTPGGTDAVLPTLEGLVQDLGRGAHLVIHCRQGIGRSSMLAAGILALAGDDLDDTWARIETARGTTVPDTPEQRAWVERLVARHAQH